MVAEKILRLVYLLTFNQQSWSLLRQPRAEDAARVHGFELRRTVFAGEAAK
jgi:hypothetical protein